MYNNDLYNKLESQFGKAKMRVFAEIMSARHELLYLEHLNEGLEEFTEEDFERDWWMDKFKSITLKEDPVIEQVVERIKSRSAVGIEKYGTTLEENNTDDFLNHLQEEMMDSVNYIQKIRNILNKKGYSKLEDVPNANDFSEEIQENTKID